ncbi:MAG TPA: thioredoxin domain-containing protein, partial [Puia sp.]|nr:thioredoxin domain-containing protein [Puia sp.]
PEGKPFYGGTYFPPRPAHNRPSWKDVLTALARTYREKPQEVEEQAQNLTRHLLQSNSFGIAPPSPGNGSMTTSAGLTTSPGIFNPSTLRQIYDQLMKGADKEQGGFGGAPKFPQTFSIQFLLHYYHFTREEQALEQACLSLDKMIAGGIYDQIGGGFARYSTDDHWLAPHFEKMLYDNALLIIVLSEAYQLTRKELYRDTIVHTMEFIRRELSLHGAFYSALDADSEGEEGKYYVWDKEEIDAVLGDDSELFCRYYGVTAAGNWEGKNILTRPFSAQDDAPVSHAVAPAGPIAPDPHAISPSDRDRLEAARLTLLEHRSHRIRPALDDKILLGWNALMNIACSKAYTALGLEEYRDTAIRNMDFCWQHFRGDGLYYFYHSYKDGQARHPAFLDDYACLTAALIQLQEITGDTSYLLKAKELTEFVSDNFSDGATGFFFFTHQDQKDLILRKKEIYDGAVPSGNSIMAFNLAYMSIIFNIPEWGDRATRMATQVHRFVTGYPGSFGIWATLYQAITYVIPEVVITGRGLDTVRKEFLRQLIPYRVFQSATEKNTQFPLLCDRPPGDSPLIFLCKDYTCQLPVNDVVTFFRLLENVQKFRH